MCHPPWAEVPPSSVALIVDPREERRKRYRALLEPLVAVVDEAEDGAEALARAMRLQPAIVIASARLPRLDAIALCMLLRADPATRHTRILIVDADDSRAELEHAIDAGADQVLAASAAPETIRTTAAFLLRRCARRTSGSLSLAGAPGARRSPSIEEVDFSHRSMLSRAYVREMTTSPPTRPLELRCPECDQPLVYLHSQIGGVSPRFPEQWDYFECRTCGRFQYRHRTRRLRRAWSESPTPVRQA